MDYLESARNAMEDFMNFVTDTEGAKTPEEKALENAFDDIEDENLKRFFLNAYESGDKHINNLVEKEKQKLIRDNENKRAQLDKYLPREFVGKQAYVVVTERFKNACVLTGSKDIEIDHFIPLSIGHGGTNFANMYPLDKTLNREKRAKNPFEWYEENRDRIDEDRWEELILYLAIQNDLTSEEFRDYVYWCFDNPRTPEEVREDPRPSVEIWKKAKRGIRS